jgi:hypothetical protein
VNFKYFILTFALIPSISCSMDKAPKKESKQPTRDRHALVSNKPTQPQVKLPFHKAIPNNNDPVATYITSMLTPITFHKKTQSIYQWLKNHQNNHFGDTPIVEMRIGIPDGPFVFDQKGLVKIVEIQKMIAQNMGNQNTIYVSHTAKRYFAGKKKPISYGTLLVWEKLKEDRNCNGQGRKSIISENVKYAMNHFLAYLTIQPQKKPKGKGIPVTEESRSDDGSSSVV